MPNSLKLDVWDFKWETILSFHVKIHGFKGKFLRSLHVRISESVWGTSWEFPILVTTNRDFNQCPWTNDTICCLLWPAFEFEISVLPHFSFFFSYILLHSRCHFAFIQANCFCSHPWVFWPLFSCSKVRNCFTMNKKVNKRVDVKYTWFSFFFCLVLFFFILVSGVVRVLRGLGVHMLWLRSRKENNLTQR